MIDVLLVNPREKGGFFEKMPPLGLAYIAACLEKNDFSVRIVDFELDKNSLTHWLRRYQPRFLGISGTTHTRFESFSLAQKAKKFNTEIITVYGGVHATFTALDTLQNVRAIDYVVRGEGEHTMVRLVDALMRNQPAERVLGIAYRDGDNICETKSAERIEDLDSLPRPAYHLLDMTQYALNMEFVQRKGISTITSRGCNARCTFCSASRMFDYKVTTHSAARVLNEVEYLFEEYGFQGLKIFDSTLTTQREHVSSLCNEITRRKLDFPWECEIRVGTVDLELLRRMKDAGCYYVSFGIESASHNVLNVMRKGFTVEQAEELLNMCSAIGMKTKVFFSYGHIGETMDDVAKTFDFVNRHQDKMTTIASGAGVRIYPGTYLEEYAHTYGLLPKGFQWSKPYSEPRLAGILQASDVPVLTQPQLGFRELEDIALKIYGKRFGGWQGFKRGMSKVTDIQKWKKLMQLAKIRLKRTHLTYGSKQGE